MKETIHVIVLKNIKLDSECYFSFEDICNFYVFDAAFIDSLERAITYVRNENLFEKMLENIGWNREDCSISVIELEMRQNGIHKL